MRITSAFTNHRYRLGATRFVALFVAIAAPLLGAANASAAPASTSTTTPKANNQIIDSWALTPTGTDPNEPGSRPNFSYTLAPGATVKDSLTVWNYGNVQLTFHIYATDAFNTPSDGFDLLAADKQARDVGAWVKISQSYLTLPASSKASLPFTLHIPANATPGDHAAGIVAASQTSAINNGGKIALDRRTGSRVYLRVSGPVTPALVVEHLASVYHASVNPLGGTLDVAYTVRNNGNVRLGAQQKVTISDVFGKVTSKQPPNLPDLLPGNAVTIRERFTGVAATLRVSTKVKLTPFVPKESGQKLAGALPTTSASVGTWAIPWTILLVLVVLAVVIVIARRRSARAPRQAAPAPTPPPAPTEVPTGVPS